jgi:Emfourin
MGQVRIEFTQEGGVAHFPGLAKPVTVNVDELLAAEASELTALVDAARFFSLPAVIGTPAKGAADYQRYTLTIEDGERRHTVRVLVPVEDQALLTLVRAVQSHVAAGRRKSSDKPSDD